MCRLRRRAAHGDRRAAALLPRVIASEHRRIAAAVALEELLTMRAREAPLFSEPQTIDAVYIGTVDRPPLCIEEEG